MLKNPQYTTSISVIFMHVPWWISQSMVDFSMAELHPYLVACRRYRRSWPSPTSSAACQAWAILAWGSTHGLCLKLGYTSFSGLWSLTNGSKVRAILFSVFVWHCYLGKSGNTGKMMVNWGIIVFITRTYTYILLQIHTYVYIYINCNFWWGMGNDNEVGESTTLLNGKM